MIHYRKPGENGEVRSPPRVKTATPQTSKETLRSEQLPAVGEGVDAVDGDQSRSNGRTKDGSRQQNDRMSDLELFAQMRQKLQKASKPKTPSPEVMIITPPEVPPPPASAPAPVAEESHRRISTVTHTHDDMEIETPPPTDETTLIEYSSNHYSAQSSNLEQHVKFDYKTVCASRHQGLPLPTPLDFKLPLPSCKYQPDTIRPLHSIFKSFF